MDDTDTINEYYDKLFALAKKYDQLGWVDNPEVTLKLIEELKTLQDEYVQR